MWKNRKVLVTGSNGFLGSHLCKSLIDLDAEVIGLYRNLHKDSELVRSGVHNKIMMIQGDLEDSALIDRIMCKYQIETIFHLGAQTDVKIAHANPVDTFRTNILGTCNLLESSRKFDTVKQIIVASSDKAYGDVENLPYTEKTKMNGIFPYDVSKSVTDLLSSTYFHTYGLPVCVTRCGNIYGGGDLNLTRIVPSSAMSVLKGEKPLIRGDGSSTRDYLYVLDAVDAYLTLAENMQINKEIWGEAFNFSSGKPLSVLDLVNKIIEIINIDHIEPEILNIAKCEINNQFLDIKKAENLLNWKPKYSIEEGLANTINWYDEYLQEKTSHEKVRV